METKHALIETAELRLPASDIRTEMPFFLKQLGFRLDKIFPADDPAVAVISGHGLRIRLERDAAEAPGTVRLECRDPDEFAGGARALTSPSGTRIEIVDAHPPLVTPQTQHSFMVRHLKDSDSWVIGRAGMQYRDLIPNRLGGSIIASHIRIPDGGPVPDMVHYHTVGFQLIFCYRGWVRLAYEDQGDPFILQAGDCVIQPPEIRHRVLEASDNLQVLELGVPAEHVTTIDHEMTLPNGRNPDREWQGTRFVHHRAAEAVWADWRIPGWQSRDTGIGAATRGLAGVHVARPSGKGEPAWTSHDTDILFSFVKEGTMTLEVANETPHALVPGDAFVLPPYVKARYVNPSADCELIEASLPADFATNVECEVS